MKYIFLAREKGEKYTFIARKKKKNMKENDTNLRFSKREIEPIYDNGFSARLDIADETEVYDIAPFGCYGMPAA